MTLHAQQRYSNNLNRRHLPLSRLASMTLPIRYFQCASRKRQSLEKLLSGLHVKLLNQLGQGLSGLTEPGTLLTGSREAERFGITW
jgi:hypothetical protein